MKLSKAPRRYVSPLRRAHAESTRERILAAMAEILAADPSGQVLFDELARRAGVERRTVFRHFPNKEALLDAFWQWINQRLSPTPLPASAADLLRLPAEVFAAFDRHEGIVRASLHTAAGREMRLRTLVARREAFARALASETEGLASDEAAQLVAVAHLLYSAAAWETLRDYCALSGEQAGRTAAWALARLFEAVRGRRPASDAPTPTPTPTQQEEVHR
jgi:AcrR family transcriptional regulator